MINIFNSASSQVITRPVPKQGRTSEARFHFSWNLTFPWGPSFTNSNTIPLFINLSYLLSLRGPFPAQPFPPIPLLFPPLSFHEPRSFHPVIPAIQI